MIELNGKPIKSMGSKAQAEDAASYMLYKFDRSSLDGRAVPMEKLAKCLGLSVLCEYVSGDCTSALGIIAYEPQRIYIKEGGINLKSPSAVIERDIIDRGESGLYSLSLAFMCAEMIFNGAKKNEPIDGQLTFGLDTVESQKRKLITLSGEFDSVRQGKDAAADFAFKLLLPKNGFKRQVAELYSDYGVNRATVTREILNSVTDELAARYAVPPLAVTVRMNQLNLC